MSKALILTDGKAGHENQSKAFARALGCEHELVEVHFKSKFHKALSYLFDHLGILTTSLLDFKVDEATKTLQLSTLNSQPSTPGVSVVIGTGSGTFYAAKAMAKKLGAKCGVVLYPRGYRLSTFDCILAPAFDRPAKADNVIGIPANLVANDEAFYAKGVESFRVRAGSDRVADSTLKDSNAIAVIIGGPNKCSTMTADWMKEQLDRIFSTAGQQVYDSKNFSTAGRQAHDSKNFSTAKTLDDKNRPRFWVTTSRRTPPEVEKVVDSYPWNFKLLYSRDHYNPIPAFVKLAKKLYVTAESTGMLSEACTFGEAEVVALDNLKPGPHKFRRFVDDLRAGGYVDGNRKIDLASEFARARKLLA